LMREAFDRPQVLAVTTVLRESSMSALGRFDPFTKPSANGRYLRTPAIEKGDAKRLVWT
jgi:hypothetical protein